MFDYLATPIHTNSKDKQLASALQFTMGRSGLYPLFLFVAFFQAVAAHVEPPTHVTLDCQNLHNVVKWHYDKIVPGLKFKVFIGSISSSPQKIVVEPPTLQTDVSFLSDPSNDYFVKVTAMIGQNESAASPPEGIQFSYFRDSLASKKCFLDFPPVNVTAQLDGNVTFRFTHPWLLYHHKLPNNQNTKPKERRRIPEFTYDVVIDGEDGVSKSFSCKNSVCENWKLSMDPEKENHCLKVKGEMKRMAVQGTQEYCALLSTQPQSDDYGYIIIVIVIMSVLAFAAVVFILFMVYRKKTRPSSNIPDSMNVTSRLKQWTFGVVQEQVLVPQVEPTSPTPLLSPTKEKEEKESTPTSSADPEFRLPIGVLTEGEREDDDMKGEEDEVPVYSQGHNLDDDDDDDIVNFSEAPSDYEKRQVFVDLGPDEQVEGYREKKWNID